MDLDMDIFFFKHNEEKWQQMPFYEGQKTNSDISNYANSAQKAMRTL